MLRTASVQHPEKSLQSLPALAYGSIECRTCELITYQTHCTLDNEQAGELANSKKKCTPCALALILSTKPLGTPKMQLLDTISFQSNAYRYRVWESTGTSSSTFISVSHVANVWITQNPCHINQDCCWDMKTYQCHPWLEIIKKVYNLSSHVHHLTLWPSG